MKKISVKKCVDAIDNGADKAMTASFGVLAASFAVSAAIWAGRLACSVFKKDTSATVVDGPVD